MSAVDPQLLAGVQAAELYREQRVPAAFTCTQAAWEGPLGRQRPAADASGARWLDVSATDAELTALVVVPASLPCFAGHFPDQPVLPGVLQLLWARELLGYQWPRCAIERVGQLKFRQPVRPPAVLRFVLQRSAGRIAARVERPAGIVANWYFAERSIVAAGTA